MFLRLWSYVPSYKHWRLMVYDGTSEFPQTQIVSTLPVTPYIQTHTDNKEEQAYLTDFLNFPKRCKQLEKRYARTIMKDDMNRWKQFLHETLSNIDAPYEKLTILFEVKEYMACKIAESLQTETESKEAYEKLIRPRAHEYIKFLNYLADLFTHDTHLRAAFIPTTSSDIIVFERPSMSLFAERVLPSSASASKSASMFAVLQELLKSDVYQKLQALWSQLPTQQKLSVLIFPLMKYKWFFLFLLSVTGGSMYFYKWYTTQTQKLRASKNRQQLAKLRRLNNRFQKSKKTEDLWSIVKFLRKTNNTTK